MKCEHVWTSSIPFMDVVNRLAISVPNLLKCNATNTFPYRNRKMANQELPLYDTTAVAWFRGKYRVYACAYFVTILGLIYYRIVFLPTQGRAVPWMLLFVSELLFAYMWILDQAFRWCPVNRQTFPHRLSPTFGEDLPPIDIFICTADPVREPPLTVVNTVLSALAFDYPVQKLACYLSDDGGSPLTFYALLEASRFAKSWIPFCKKYSIEQRCPEAFFSRLDLDHVLTFTSELNTMKELYEAMKDHINNAAEKGTIPKDIEKEHDGFKAWNIAGISRHDHHSIVQILLENGEDTDAEGSELPTLVYVSREKRPGYPHHFKAGALNALIRVSAMMSNAPFTLFLDCDMYANNSQALRHAMCFFMDSQSGHEFGFVQFPQRFVGITKNDPYANSHIRPFDIQLKGMDGIQGPLCAGTGCIFRRDALFESHMNPQIDSDKNNIIMRKSGSSPRLVASVYSMNESENKRSRSKMMEEVVALANCTYEKNTDWGKKVGMIYGCTVEDVLAGFTVHCRGWKSAYCDPNPKAFMGCAPTNCNDLLVQHKRWSAGFLELFMSKFCPFTYGVKRTRIAQRMGYGYYCIWAVWSVPMLFYALIPGLCMLNGLSLFPKVTESWFAIFAMLSLAGYTYSAFEFTSIAGGTLKGWWNEQRMWMMKGASSYLVALIQVICKLIGIAEVGFEVTSKVVDGEAIKRYEAEVLEFGAASWLFLPPATLVLINFISVLGGMGRFLLQRTNEWVYFECMFAQLFLSSFIIIIGYPLLEAMFLRNDRGRIPTSITFFSMVVAFSVCYISSIILS